ncbi:hypothetical protein ACFL02_03960 [Planctomycetota bacterium]
MAQRRACSLGGGGVPGQGAVGGIIDRGQPMKLVIQRDESGRPCFGPVPNWIFDCGLASLVGATAMSVYAFRSVHSIRSRGNKCYHSQENIVKLSGIKSVKTVREADRRLEAAGLIQRTGEPMPGFHGIVYKTILDPIEYVGKFCPHIYPDMEGKNAYIAQEAGKIYRGIGKNCLMKGQNLPVDIGVKTTDIQEVQDVNKTLKTGESGFNSKLSGKDLQEVQQLTDYHIRKCQAPRADDENRANIQESFGQLVAKHGAHNIWRLVVEFTPKAKFGDGMQFLRDNLPHLSEATDMEALAHPLTGKEISWTPRCRCGKWGVKWNIVDGQRCGYCADHPYKQARAIKSGEI